MTQSVRELDRSVEEPLPKTPRRVGLLVVLTVGAAAAFLAGSSVSTEVRRDAPTLPELPAPPSRPTSAWYLFRSGSTLVTRTKTTEAAFVTVATTQIRVSPDGKTEDFCEESSYWTKETTSVDRHYRLLSLQQDHAQVVMVPRLPNGRRQEVEQLRFDRRPGPLTSPEVLEERSGVVVEVPAGAITCTYRRERGRSSSGLPAVVETWSNPKLPLPVQRVVTWKDPAAPRRFENTERRVLLSAELIPARSPD